MSRNVIVAKALSKQGGKCACGCELKVPQLGVIYKIADEGQTTTGGNGPGFWVRPQCAGEYSDPRGIYEAPLF